MDVRGAPGRRSARLAVADRRAYQVRLVYDEQWLRLLDVDAALAARTYAEAVDGVTIAVRDDLFPANTGVWRDRAEGRRAGTEADPADADLATDVATLAAAYLGGTRGGRCSPSCDPSTAARRARCGGGDRRRPLATDSARRPPFCGSFFVTF